MQALTGLDASFLYLETPEMPMHVGSFNLCELPAGFKGSFHKAVKNHIARRMHLAPLFSRKLVFMPLDLGHPVWVQADSVDINFHIRRADLARKGASPMTLAKAHQRCAQLHGELIDRDFPLWEFHVFNRIKMPDGKIVAGFFSKIHHAALDGKGGVMLANAMLDLTPVPRNVTLPGPSRHREREADLTLGKMIGSVFSSSLGQLSKLAKALPSAAHALGGTLARQSVAGSAAGLLARASMKLAPLTPFNTGITTGRVFTTATLPLADCKAMGKAIGGSLNDIVLWLCSTALRDYLSQRHSLPKKSLVAAMPVSLREAGAGGATDSSKLGNQVSISLVQLGTHLAHPLKRMNAIMTSTAKVKTSMQSLKGLLPTDYPSLLAPWLVGGAGKLALNVYGKSGMVAHLPRLANLAISNVPGPPVPPVSGRRKALELSPAVNHPAWARAQHHRSDLCRSRRIRHRCRQEGAAACQGAGQGDCAGFQAGPGSAGQHGTDSGRGGCEHQKDGQEAISHGALRKNPQKRCLRCDEGKQFREASRCQARRARRYCCHRQQPQNIQCCRPWQAHRPNHFNENRPAKINPEAFHLCTTFHLTPGCWPLSGVPSGNSARCCQPGRYWRAHRKATATR